MTLMLITHNLIETMKNEKDPKEVNSRLRKELNKINTLSRALTKLYKIITK